MESEYLNIILQTKEWYNQKIEQLKLVKEPISIKFENSEGVLVDLPEMHIAGFKLGIKIALETFGEFLIEISKSEDESDDE